MGKEKRAFFWQKLHSCYHRFPFLRSLRLRIFLIVFVLGVMPCLAMRGAILSNYETRVVNIRTGEVQTQLRILANHLLTYEYLRNPSSPIVDAELEQFSSFYDGRVLVIDGSLRVVKDTYDMSTGKTVVSGDVVRCLQNGSRAITGRYVKNDRYLEVIVPISETKALENMDFSGNGSSSEEVSGVLLASVSTDSIAATLEVLGRRANLLMLFMSVVVFSVAVLAAAFLTAEGPSYFEDTVFEHRFGCAAGFSALGGRVKVRGRLLELAPAERLQGAAVSAADLRGGAALAVAALQAQGESTIAQAGYIRRGYGDLAALLRSRGARAEWDGKTERENEGKRRTKPEKYFSEAGGISLP